MATFVWSGLAGDGLFSTGGNWVGGVAPPTAGGYNSINIAASVVPVVISAGQSYSNYNELDVGPTANLNIFGSFGAQTVVETAGGLVNVETGGSLNLNSLFTANGALNVAGTANIQGGVTVGTLGAFNVTGNATVAGAAITVNGTLDVAKGATLTGANSLVVNGTASFEGTYVDSSAFIGGTGTYVIDGGSVGTTGTPTTITGGSAPKFIISQGGALYTTNANQAASFTFGGAVTGKTNTLFIPNYVSPITVPITNFGPGDAIELSSGQTLISFTPTSNGNGTYKIALNANGYTPVTLNNVTLAAGVTPGNLSIIQNGSMSELVGCFYAGTRLATPHGEIAVEDITAGTMLLTASGEAKPVRWLGRSLVAPSLADPLLSLPIRVKAGALAAGLPVRDLLLSPCHALLVGGVLVQAGALVNGISITRETDVPKVFTYYHVELAGHEVLFAEGAKTESFIDNVDRMVFENWAEHEALGLAAIAEMELPRAKSHRQVPRAVLAMLNARLGEFEALEPVAVAA